MAHNIPGAAMQYALVDGECELARGLGADQHNKPLQLGDGWGHAAAPLRSSRR